MTKLYEKVKSGKIINDAWTNIPSSWSAEVVAKAGFDTMTIDAQHGLATDLSTILPMLQAIEGTGTSPMVRLPTNEGSFAMSMLDAGVEGLICPMIRTVEDTEQFVKNCLYQPLGERSFGPIRAAKVHENYFQEANESILKLVMIETQEAYDNIDEIAAVEHLSGFYIGPWDLSLGLGLDKIADFQDPVLLSIFDKIVNTATKHGKLVGIHCTNPTDARQMIDKFGFQLVTTFNDTTALSNAAAQSLKTFNTPH